MISPVLSQSQPPLAKSTGNKVSLKKGCFTDQAVTPTLSKL